MRSAIKRGVLSASRWDRSRWLAVGLTLLAWALMSWRLGEKSLWWDESLSLYRAQQNIRTILAGRIDFPGVETVDQHPPLYFLLLKGVIALGGEADTSLRLPSAFFGVILVALLYVGGRLLRNQRAGVLAALLGAISPFYLWYAQEARMYTMVTALTLAATLCLWWAIVRTRRMGFVGFGLLAAAALVTHYLTALLLVYWAILALALWGMRPRSSDMAASSRWRQVFAWFGIGALAIAVFFLLWQLPHLIPAPGIYDKFVPLPIILRDIFNSYSLGLSVVFSKHWPLLIPFGLLGAIGLVSVWVSPPPAEAPIGMRRAVGLYTLLGYIAVPAGLIGALSHYVPFYTNSRYLMASSPAFYLALALALERLGQKKAWLGVLAAAIPCALMLYSTGRYFFEPRYASKEDYRGLVRYIEMRMAPGDVILLTGPESLTAFRHYYRGAVPLVALPHGKMPFADLSRELARLGAIYERIWHVNARRAFTDPTNLTQRWLDEHAFQENTVLFPSAGFHLALRTYLPAPVVRDVPTEGVLGAFDPLLRLSQADVRYWDETGDVRVVPIKGVARSAPSERPAIGPVIAGQSLGMTFTWGVEHPLPELHLSLRLVQGEAIWAQADQPLITYWPTNQWEPGKAVTHVATLPIPPDTPAAQYALQVILYRREDAQPLSFRDAATGLESPYILLAPVTVVRPHEAKATCSPLPGGLHTPWGGLTFQGGLRLVAYGMGPTSVRPGERITLHLYWQADRPQEEDALLVVNWADADRRVRYTETFPLAGVADSPRQWPVGARVHGVISIPVPEDAVPGAYSLHLLVQRASGPFLWVRRGFFFPVGHDMRLGQVTVRTP